MSSLPSPELLPILKRLNAAVGYINLGMPQEAWNELEDIEAKERARPEVLKVRVEVCRALKQWEMMAEVSNHLRKIEPDEVGHPLNMAYATRRFKNEAEGSGDPVDGSTPLLRRCLGALQPGVLLVCYVIFLRKSVEGFLCVS